MWGKRSKEHPAYGRKHSLETRRKLSEMQKGSKNSFWGKHHAIEVRQKMSQTRRGRKSSNWKGGKTKASNGYVYIYMPKHPRAHKSGYILEHRLVMEEYLGRFLESWEIVHHRNNIKNDNRLENLELLPKQADHIMRQRIKTEKMKWQRAFYRAIGYWLAQKRKTLTG